MHGYAARSQEATATAAPLWARALAIDDSQGDGPAVMIVAEVLGVPIDLTREVAQRLQLQAGVAPERVVVMATHTHNGPMVRGVAPTIFGEELPADQQRRVDRYTDELADRLTEAAMAALSDRRPARISWETGEATFAANRRSSDGPVDHRVPTLAARDLDGRLIAVVGTYACHCTTLGPTENRLHGDWAGVAAAQLEAAYPSAIALVTIGCGADANPHPRPGLKLAQQHGNALAGEIQRILAGPMKQVRLPLICRRGTVDLPFDALPSEAEWRERAAKAGAIGYHARRQLARLEAGESLPRVLPYEIASWSFGKDLSMVFLAGEVVVDYAIRMQDDFDGSRLWLHAYANDAPCYIPSRRVWREGGYEAGDAMVYYDQPTRLVAEAEDLIVDAIQRLLPHEYYSPALARDFPPGRSPQESLRSIRVPPGLRVELAAAEPLVVDPVAFDWGPDGRLWVVEMRDYPNGANQADGTNGSRGANHPQGHDAQIGGGRIVWLEDTDGDGSFDQSHVFVDNLPYPTGVKAWRDGILVTAAPDILQFKDSDGDGKADVRKVLYTGFGEGNQQHRVNGLRWGLDNWLYVGNGDSNGKIRSTVSGEVVDVSGRDLRIRPDSGKLEAIAGPTQFGRSMNDWGDWFGGNNSNPLWHYALSDAYLRRNPHVTAPSMRKDVPQAPGTARVYPASRTLERFNDLHAANRFTSACSPILYRDRLLGSKYAGNSFVCEPVHNLVHREIISASGTTFTSRRAKEESESEFLVSDDNWFRPVMIRSGPDGALWVADMYRYVIEHPEWIPEDFLRKMDVAAGGDRGRIYRVLPTGAAARKLPQLDVLTTKQLVEALDSPNGWQRDMVQQLLLWREDPDCRPLLEEMAIRHDNPLARLHALCTLDGLEMLSAPILQTGLQDSQAEVRRHAIRLSEPLLDENPALLDAMLDRLDDDLRVQQQLAYSLGETVSPQAGAVLAELLLRHQDKPYLATPAFSSLRSENVAAIFTKLVNAPAASQPSVALLRELARQSLLLAPERAKPMLREFLQSNDWTLDVGLAIGVELLPSLDAAEASAIGELMLNARSLMNNPNAELMSRQLAVELLAQQLSADSEVAEELGELVSPREPVALQQAAVRALVRLPDERAVTDRLLSAWAQAAPAVRADILDAILSDVKRTHLLLARLSQPEDTAILLSAADRDRLLHHSDAGVQQRAAELYQQSSESRGAVTARIAEALQKTPSAEQGQAVFKKLCATCHRLDNAGYALGPDLTALTNNSPAALATAILDPNRAVEDKYLSYTILTVDGQLRAGLIAEETSNHITLAAGEGRSHTVLRTDIQQMQSSDMSLMPEGLEKDLSAQDLADVIAYLRSHRAPPKEFPNNQPQLVRASDGRSLQLLATSAAVYGPRLVFEQKYRNLGWWVAPGDRAIWEADIPTRGRYRVSLEYAAPAEAAGNQFVVAVGLQTLSGEVKPTGSWDVYQWSEAGDIDLPPGRADVMVRSAGAIREFLFDLRGVHLERIDASPATESEDLHR